ncbi:sensor histidine kinase, partial [Streptomyces filamentosus]|uniref:sensor histidine kinase n=1 Tax=Streptomyces filamentosus TaxID=67294 RepID=UPI0033597610
LPTASAEPPGTPRSTLRGPSNQPEDHFVRGCNARKHAPDAPVRIRITYKPPATLIEVTNPPGRGPGIQQVPSGFGLIGLRERVEALGGSLSAGPGGAGSWRLAARIPHPVPDQNGPRT